jgi:3-oxoacyl-[acyl-carrier protein] reductase
MLQADVALVTGASRGIGRAIALALAGAGARVIGTSTSAEGAAALQAEFASHGYNGRGAVLDVADESSIGALLGELEQASEMPTILVNNAAITRDMLLLRMMRDRRGRIINIASIVAVTGNPGQANYAAAKAGMLGFTKSLAREVASRGITVNAVAPGFIDTDMTRSMSEAQRAQLTAQVPMERLGTPEDVAAAVLFLASPGAAYITGETLHVNGGMYMP